MKPGFILLLLASVLIGESLFAQNFLPNTSVMPAATNQPLHAGIVAFDSNMQYSYVRTLTPARPFRSGTQVLDTTLAGRDIRQAIQYADGLGRTFQVVERRYSPSGRDLVTPMEYDSLGIGRYQYLPYAAADSTGQRKNNPFSAQAAFLSALYNPTNNPAGEKFFYGNSRYEPYPGGRPTLEMSPGNSWAGAGRGTSHTYGTNLDNEVVIWKIDTAEDALPASVGFYRKGRLSRTAIADEQGQQQVEYRDIQGNVIMRRNQLNKCTYYVYDEFNNQRFVIPPLAVDSLAAHSWNMFYNMALPRQLCYSYYYDYRGRVVARRTPGAGKVKTVYDAWDRAIMVQDSNLFLKNQWVVNQYDVLGRPTASYLWNDGHDRTYHAALANDTVNYPTLTGTYTLLMQTYYDNYNWVSTSGSGLSATFQSSETANGFYPVSLSGYPYAQPFSAQLQLYSMTQGVITGTKRLILEGGGYQYNVTFYDNSGRPVQTQSTNQAGGIDYVTTQYGFDGRVLVTRSHQLLPGKTPDSLVTLTKFYYDNRGRLTEVRRKLDSFPEVSLVRNTYNELGQLKQRQLGQQVVQGSYTSDPIDVQDYTYNIRGWLSAVNKDYARGNTNDRNFAEDISYDYGFNVVNNGYFNGNISGIRWRSKGDGTQRAYGFNYEAANRITNAQFAQYLNGAWGNATATDPVKFPLDYSANSASKGYDANGNILSMIQYGYSASNVGVQVVDNLLYSYFPNSNQVKNIWDAVNNPTSLAGDFHTSTLHATGHNITVQDYSYDGNGNMIRDLNRDIDSAGATGITYNYLNLPDTIRVINKGSILYQYDASGAKLSKTIRETGKPDVTFRYFGGSVYRNDTMQYLAHEAGRVRYAKKYYSHGGSGYQYFNDYFLKDHLSNTRVVLTEQVDTFHYVATMDSAYRATEKQLFYGLDTSVVARSLAEGYPVDTSMSNPNDSVTVLNSSGKNIGPWIILKVMSGDRIDISANYFYNVNTPGQTGTPPYTSLAALFAPIFQSFNPGALKNVSLMNTHVNSMLGYYSNDVKNNSDTNHTKAYLNYVTLDNMFDYVAGQSGALQVGATGTDNGKLRTPLFTTLPISTSGYVCIFLSNIDPVNVYFDNLSIVHTSGQLVEENHYYPFGLAMVPLSDKTLKPGYRDNKYRYNTGTEIQNKEFSDGTGLEWYQTPLRTLDPQIGRWWQPDSKPDMTQSPYNSMSNNPISFNDPLGDTSVFYGSNGNYIFTVNDNSRRNAVVLDAKKEDAFYNDYYHNFLPIPDDKRNYSVMSANLGQYGNRYDIGALSRFFDVNNGTVPATKVGGESTASWTNITIDGKPTKLYAEVEGNLVRKNGMVTVGVKTYSEGDFAHDDPSMVPLEANTVGNIHLHPIWKNGTLAYSPRKGDRSNDFFYAGPSNYNGDQGLADTNMERTGVWNVVVDQKFIYLINGNPSQTIKILR